MPVGLFDTDTGKEDGMKYIATGPGLWLVMTIANVKVQIFMLVCMYALASSFYVSRGPLIITFVSYFRHSNHT